MISREGARNVWTAACRYATVESEGQEYAPGLGLLMPSAGETLEKPR